VVADALSRRPHADAPGAPHLRGGDEQLPPSFLAALSTCLGDPELLMEVKTGYLDDPVAEQLLKDLHAGTAIPWEESDGLLFTLESGRRQLYVPNVPALRETLLLEHHDSRTAGHLGMDKTLEFLGRNFFWPGMKEDVHAYVRTCESCQRNKATNKAPLGLLRPLPIPASKWEHVSMDLVTQLPKTRRGHTAIVTFVDRLTKMVHFAPVGTDIDAPTLAHVFFSVVFKLHGLPKHIVSDRDPRFMSKFWEALFKLMGTKLAMSTAFHPQTDGQTERAHRTLEDMLRAYVNDKHDDWDLHLAAAEFAYNNSRQASTGFTPFYLNYGIHPLTPSQVQFSTGNKAAEDFTRALHMDLNQAKEKLAQAQQRQARFADSRRRDGEFRIGEKVMLSTAHLQQLGAGKTRKFQAKFIGPFEIIQVISPVAYKLALPRSLRMHPVFHASLLRPHKDGRDRFPLRERYSRPPPVWSEGQDKLWEVDRIIGKRAPPHAESGAAEYLVLWRGYPESEADWLPHSELTHLQDLIDQFEHTQQPRSTRGQRGR
jgi:hypothetical protein